MLCFQKIEKRVQVIGVIAPGVRCLLNLHGPEEISGKGREIFLKLTNFFYVAHVHLLMIRQRHGKVLLDCIFCDVFWNYHNISAEERQGGIPCRRRNTAAAAKRDMAIGRRVCYNMESGHDRKGRTANGKNGGRMINCSANLPFCKSADAGGCERHEHLYEPGARSAFSYFDTGKNPSEGSRPEHFYHGFVLGLMVELADRYTITSNRESGFGRYDVMLMQRTGQMTGSFWNLKFTTRRTKRRWRTQYRQH